MENPDDRTATLTGGCLCGAVRYRIDGAPAFAGLCHCRDCQRSSGSAFAAFHGVPKQAFHLTGPIDTYTSLGGSGQPAHRHFCSRCGSTVYGSGAYPFVTVYAGTLDDPARFAPREQVNVRSRVPWAHLAPGSLPEHARMPRAGDEGVHS